MVRYSEPFLLSSSGSTRATAYGFSNKSITVDGRTHVVWLDAVAQVCGRTYDHGARQWSDTYRLFEGCDNHTSPALALDKDKRLHVAYGPHGFWGKWNYGMFKWAISEKPGRMDAWTGEESFGYNATYACLVHTTRDVDVIVYRGGDAPASLMLQKQRPLGGWTSAREIVRQDIAPQYTHLGATAACAADGTLYVACHLYNVGGDYHGPRELQRSHGVVVLKTSDLGETWTDMRGEPVTVPALYEERIALPPLGANMRMNGLAVDSRGRLWALSGSAGAESREVLLSRWTDAGWEATHLEPCLPADRIAVDCVLTIDTRDRIHAAVTALRPKELAETSGDGAWGHPSCEVFHLVSDVGVRDFECHQISTADETTANWLPNISLKGLHQPVEKPVILYTRGVKGDGCSPSDKSEVYCVFVEEID